MAAEPGPITWLAMAGTILFLTLIGLNIGMKNGMAFFALMSL